MFYQRSLLYRLLDSFFRHRLIFLISTIIVILIVGAALATKPKSYVGGYTVIEDTRIVPNPLTGTMSTGSEDIQDSIDHLQSLISTSDFLKEALKNSDGSTVALDIPLNPDDPATLADLRKEITVESSANDAFTVSMDYKDAGDITTILSAIINTWKEQTAQEKSAYFSQEVAFIQGLVNKYKMMLADSEDKLTRFKAENINNLPEQQAAIEGQITSLQSEESDLEIDVQSDGMKEAELQGQLATVPKTIVSNMVTGDSPLQAQLKNLEATRTTDMVTLHMKPTHPEIVELNREIASLQQTINQMAKNNDPQASGAQTTDTMPNPEYQSLSNELIQLQIDEKSLDAKIANIDVALAKAKLGEANIPAAQRTLANLTRDYSVDSTAYNSLVQKLGEAQIDEQLNLNQGRSIYTVLETSQPMSAMGLSKVLAMFFGGVVVAIVVGLALVVLSEWLDPSLRDPMDTQRILELPLLAVLPESAALLRGEYPETLLSGPNSEIKVSKALPG